MTESPQGYWPGPQNHMAPLTQLSKRLTGSLAKFGEISELESKVRLSAVETRNQIVNETEQLQYI